jgi:hypothetical protein
MKLVVALLLAACASCTGTDGTLVVLHDGDGASGAPPVELPGPYQPDPSLRWFAKLDGAVDPAKNADFFYLDAWQQRGDELEALRGAGKPYICYLSAGTVESFRPDADEFPERSVGNVVVGFENERWLDVRDPRVRELMGARVAELQGFGCAAVMPSSLGGYAVDSGFPLTENDALDYARYIAERVHAGGMSVGLNAPPALTQVLWPSFDFGLAIGCIEGSRCSEYAVFEPARKPVLYLELGNESDALELCKSAQVLGFTPLISDAGFTGQCTDCRDIL